MGSLLLHEASFSVSPIQESEQRAKGIWLIRLIEADVQGSSGYYPADTLRRDGPAVFPEGTHVYFDHPSDSEDLDRPERSVRDLAGSFIEDAYFIENGPDGSGLFARVQLFPDVHQWMESRHRSVGMSIRAEGQVAEGDQGSTIVGLTRGMSVDIVTRAGAGGKVLSLMESGKKMSPQGDNSSGAGTSAPIEELAAKLDSLLEGQSKVTDALGALAQVLKESTESKEKAEEEKVSLSAADLVGRLDESDLPVVSRKRVAAAFEAGGDLDALIKDESDLVRQISESVSSPKSESKSNCRTSVKSGVVEESGKAEDNSKKLDDVYDFLSLGD